MAQQYTNAGAIAQAEQLAKLFGDEETVAEMRLFKAPFVPGAATTLAQLNAQQCDFSGYGPIVCPTPLAPYLGTLGGASITVPTVQFNYGPPTVGTPVGNDVGGWYLQTRTADGAGTMALASGTFDQPIPMQVGGNAVTLNVTLVVGR